MANSPPLSAKQSRLTSGQLCDVVGISRGALRLYEREKLISPPPRSEGGYRLYPAETVDVLELIKLVKSLGFGLADVREMLELLGGGPGSEQELRELAARHLAAVDERIAGLTELREGLAAFAAGDTFEDDEECAALTRVLKARARKSEAQRANPGLGLTKTIGSPRS